MFASRKARLIAASAALGLGALAVPGTAFAATPNQTNCTPGSCTGAATGTITVSQTLAIDLTFSAFPITTQTAMPPNSNLAGQVEVESNDAAGYFVTEGSTDYTSGGNTIPASEVDAANALDTYHQFSESPGVTTFVNATDASTGGVQMQGATTKAGYDTYGVENYVLDPSFTTVPAGTYTGTATFTLWGS